MLKVLKKSKKVLKKSNSKNHLFKGIVHIHSTKNNTIITVTNLNGDTISWASAGSLGFKGSRKNTSFSAQLVSEKAIFNAIDSVNLKIVQIFIKGRGYGRQTALRTVRKTGVSVSKIRDVTVLPHNGCRPPKRRRV